MRQLNKRNSLLVLFFVAALLAVSNLSLAANPVTNCTSTAELEAEIPNGGTITFNCGTATIPITNDIDVALGSVTGGSVIIDGGNTITLDVTTAGADSRAFDFTGTGSITLRNLTIQGGDLTGAGGAPGGAIRVAAGGTLNLENVIVRDNFSSTGAGGAISIAGAAGNAGTVNVFRSAFLGNDSTGNGGVFNMGSNTFLNVANSTFSGNSAVNGGVLRISGGTNGANFTNNTFVANTATTTGSVISNGTAAAASIQLRNNILVGAAPAEALCAGDLGGLVGGVNLSTGNLVFNGTCPGITAASTANPNLVDNTAQTIPHYALPAGSPAIDLAVDTNYLSAGTNTLFTGAINIDQPGTVRPQGAGVDAGSFEFVVAASTSTPENTATTAATATPDPTGTTAATATSTTDPAVTPTETATTDPNVTPTETATTDPNVTPTETATTDPNVTPTIEATATSTTEPVPGAFNLLTPANNVIVRDPSAVTAITWSVASGADAYRFLLLKLSENTRLGVVLDLAGLTGAADSDPLTCEAVCTLTVDAAVQALLGDGQYAWTVFASNAFGETESSNSPFFFTVNTGDLELVVNGEFELVDLGGNTVLEPWVGKNLTGDKIQCNKVGRPGLPDKIFAYEGSCAFRFKGGAGEASKIQQNLEFAGLVAQGDTLTFSLYVDSNNAVGKIGTLKVRYSEPTAGENSNGRDKINLRLDAPSAGGNYELVSDNVTVAGTITSLKVQVGNRATSGKFWVDNVSVIAAPAVAATPTADATVDTTTTPEPTGTEAPVNLVPLP